MSSLLVISLVGGFSEVLAGGFDSTGGRSGSSDDTEMSGLFGVSGSDVVSSSEFSSDSLVTSELSSTSEFS